MSSKVRSGLSYAKVATMALFISLGVGAMVLPTAQATAAAEF